MKKINIRIDRLNIGIKGVSTETIRSSVVGLEKELLAELVNQRESLAEQKMKKIIKIESGIIKATSDVTSYELRKMIVKSVIKSLPQKTLMDSVK